VSRSSSAANPRPNPLLVIDPDGFESYPREFFLQDTVKVAQEIIGSWIVRRYGGKWYGARIVETEAYLGVNDRAAHSWRGRRTPRVEPMYMEGGHLYVFFVYGMHYCANIVTGPAGIPEAVLLRAAEGPAGTPPKMMSGPARLCSALGINTEFNGYDLLSGNHLRILRGTGKPRKLGISPRIGVAYAGEAANWPLRFFDIDSEAVSGPAHLNLRSRAKRVASAQISAKRRSAS